MKERNESSKRRWFLLGITLLGIFGTQWILTRSQTGQAILKTQWGLNVRHYSELTANIPSFDRSDPGESGSMTAGLNKGTPTLSSPTGIYPSGLQVEVGALPKNSEAYFSTDGSIPTRGHPRARGPISIPETTVLRVKAFGSEATPSEVISASYIVRPVSTLPVVSLVLDPVYLFNKHAGIVANRFQRGRAWERPATFSILSRDSPATLQVEGKIRVNGNASRIYPTPSLRLYLSSDDSAELARWFGSDSTRVSPRQTEWILRRTGNRSQIFRERLGMAIAQQLGLSVGPYIPCLLYVNGELWGVFDIVERINPAFASKLVGGTEVDVLKGSLNRPTATAGDAAPWREFFAFVAENDLTDPAVYEQVQNTIDIENFIKFWILEIFIADSETPQWNINLIRNPNGSALWQLLPWDLEQGFNYLGVYLDHDTFAWHSRSGLRFDLKPTGAEDHDEYLRAAAFLRRLLENRSFRETFRHRFDEMLDLVLTTENLSQVFQEVREIYGSAKEIELLRFENASTGTPEKQFQEQIDQIQDFLIHRPAIVRSLLDQHLPLGENENENEGVPIVCLLNVLILMGITHYKRRH